jgi:hypothetical protein
MHKIHSEFSAHRKDIGIRRNFGRNDHICCWILIKTFLTSHTPNYFLFLHVIEVLEDGGETRVTIGTTSIGIGDGGVLGSRNIEVFSSPFNMTPRSMFSLDECRMSVEPFKSPKVYQSISNLPTLHALIRRNTFRIKK